MSELVIRSEQDVADFVNKCPSTRSSWLVIFVALGGIFVDAYHFSSLGIGVPQLTAQLHLTPLEVGSVTAIMSVGGFIGALWGGYWTDRLGRYEMALLDLVLLIIGAVGTALSVNLWMLLVFRFLLGVGVGIDFPVALSFIAEYVNERNKGTVNVWQPTWYIAASFLGVVLLPFYYWANLGDYLWRIAVGFGAIPALIVLFLRYKYMGESPMWAAQNRGLEAAGKILQRVYGVQVTVNPEIKVAKPKPNVRFRELFDFKYRSRLVLVTFIGVTGAAEYYAIGFNLPSISMQIFGGSFIYAILGAIFFNLFGVLGGFSAVWKTTTLGTRKMALIGFGIVLVSMLAFWWGGSKLPIAVQVLLICAFIFGHSFGPAANGNTMAAFSFPTRMRGMAIGWSHSTVRFGSIMGFFFFPLVMAKVGLHTMMLWLAIFPLIGLFATWKIKWDPTGRNIEKEEEALRAEPVCATSTEKE